MCGSHNYGAVVDIGSLDMISKLLIFRQVIGNVESIKNVYIFDTKDPLVSPYVGYLSISYFFYER